MKNFTLQQQRAIDSRGKDLLVSASAGTGKTTVMIERIAKLLEKGEADITEIVVVTFTNLAAAEMKRRLADKLSEKRSDSKIAEQLEKIDSANISTLHSFCSELLRNYFYVADVDPAFSVLDSVAVAALRKNALSQVMNSYYAAKDVMFDKVYQIFASNRREENFSDVIFGLYDFASCLEDFTVWYEEKRLNFTRFEADNAVFGAIVDDIASNLTELVQRFTALAENCEDCSAFEFSSICRANAETLSYYPLNLESALDFLNARELNSLPVKNAKRDSLYKVAEEELASLRKSFAAIKEDFNKFRGKYAELTAKKNLDRLKEDTELSVEITDKLVEITVRFGKEFSEEKKQRGGIDFNDLEKSALLILNDSSAAADIREKYKMLFVDEYQDTNPIQEAILSRLCSSPSLFTVGDVKQSIYGFRGCEPTIFLNKYRRYKADGTGEAVELNDNFRSNSLILDFVNDVFTYSMTEKFGKIDYAGHAKLSGPRVPVLRCPSVRIDVINSLDKDGAVAENLYDIKNDLSERISYASLEGELISKRIKETVGMAYKDKKGEPRRIGYGDIVILTRSMTDNAAEIYNTLIADNIPVVASFKTDGLKNKEVREILNLLRVVDNAYDDLYLAGVCLSYFGGFDESELASVKTETSDAKRPLIERLRKYVGEHKDAVAEKIDALLSLIEDVKFYSHGTAVDKLALEILRRTEFHLHVQGLPNGQLRIRKLYAFIDEIKNKYYSRSVDKFLSYIEESNENYSESAITGANAVRMMTMHAAKGLEFPVVIVAGASTPFKNVTDAVEKNADIGLSVRNYDFQTMKRQINLGFLACGLCNEKKRKEEELRLLYVALTRAENMLIIVSSRSEELFAKKTARLPQNSRSHIEWIASAMVNKYGGVTSGFEADGISFEFHSEVSAPVLEKYSVDELLCTQDTDKESLLKKINYVYPYDNVRELPLKVVSSALDKAFIYKDEERSETALCDDGDRQYIGTAYHKVYETVRMSATLAEIDGAIELLVRSGSVEKRHAELLDRELICRTLGNKRLIELMSTGKVFRELPFMLYVPYSELYPNETSDEPVILQGVIDVLVIDGDKASVIDFKYTKNSKYVKTNYSAQLNSYAIAVKRITGIENTKAYIFSISDNKLTEM